MQGPSASDFAVSFSKFVSEAQEALTPVIARVLPHFAFFMSAVEQVSEALVRPTYYFVTVTSGLSVLALVALCCAILVLIFRFCFSSSKPNGPSILCRHILVETETFATTLKEHMSKKRGDKLLAMFGDLAREHSTIDWSGAVGGALGWIGPGKFGREFDRVAWSAPLLTLQGPVQTEAGWHLILVIERQGRLEDAEGQAEGKAKGKAEGKAEGKDASKKAAANKAAKKKKN